MDKLQPTRTAKEAGQEGLKLYSDTKSYEKLKLDLESMYERVIDTCESRLTKPRLSAEDVQACFKSFIEYLRLYQKAEFFYTDTAFEHQDKNEELKRTCFPLVTLN